MKKLRLRYIIVKVHNVKGKKMILKITERKNDHQKEKKLKADQRAAAMEIRRQLNYLKSV